MIVKLLVLVVVMAVIAALFLPKAAASLQDASCWSGGIPNLSMCFNNSGLSECSFECRDIYRYDAVGLFS